MAAKPRARERRARERREERGERREKEVVAAPPPPPSRRESKRDRQTELQKRERQSRSNPKTRDGLQKIAHFWAAKREAHLFGREST